jgi:hypothetical protein
MLADFLVKSNPPIALYSFSNDGYLPFHIACQKWDFLEYLTWKQNFGSLPLTKGKVHLLLFVHKYRWFHLTRFKEDWIDSMFAPVVGQT